MKAIAGELEASRKRVSRPPQMKIVKTKMLTKKLGTKLVSLLFYNLIRYMVMIRYDGGVVDSSAE